MARAKKKDAVQERIDNYKYMIDKAYEALHLERAEHEKTKKDLQELKEDYFNLQSLYRKETGKSVPLNLKPLVQIELEKEIEWLKAETVSVKEFEREKFAKEQYMRLLDEEKKKRNELKEHFETQIDTNIDILQEQIKKLEEELEEEKEKHSRKGTGRKRNSNTPDEAVLKLRSDGKTIKTIQSLTGISTATINRILHKFKTESDTET